MQSRLLISAALLAAALAWASSSARALPAPNYDAEAFTGSLYSYNPIDTSAGSGVGTFNASNTDYWNSATSSASVNDQSLPSGFVSTSAQTSDSDFAAAAAGSSTAFQVVGTPGYVLVDVSFSISVSAINSGTSPNGTLAAATLQIAYGSLRTLATDPNTVTMNQGPAPWQGGILSASIEDQLLCNQECASGTNWIYGNVYDWNNSIYNQTFGSVTSTDGYARTSTTDWTLTNSVQIWAYAGDPYSVTMTAFSYARAYYGTAGGSASASVDPTIVIDPTYAASGYSLQLSQGLATPEPSTWALMAIGFLGLSAASGYRRRVAGRVRHT